MYQNHVGNGYPLSPTMCRSPERQPFAGIAQTGTIAEWDGTGLYSRMTANEREIHYCAVHHKEAVFGGGKTKHVLP